MKWSWRIGTLAGIDLHIHATFPLILLWVAFSAYLTTGELAGVGSGMLLILSLFGVVVLHELGHALTARRYGISTRDITLLPIGGLARLEKMPDDPWQEMVVAVAGPLVNLVLAAACYLLILLLGITYTPQDVGQFGSPLLVNLLWINVALAVFNMIPAFPMDGGRVLRGLLALSMDYVHATRTAAAVGQTVAILFGFVGLLANPFLILIALFVWMGAVQEAQSAEIRTHLHGVPIHETMVKEFHVLSPDDPLQKAVDYMVAGFQQDFPVEQEGNVVGVLTRHNAFKALAEGGNETPIGKVMRTDFQTASPDEPAEEVFTRLQTSDCRTIPVCREDGKVVGIASLENLGEFLMIRGAESNQNVPLVAGSK